MDTNEINNCCIEIQFDYLNERLTIKLEDEELCDIIRHEIRQMSTEIKAWFPNDEVDNRICRYIDDKIKNEAYYKKGVHPSRMVIILSGIIHHVIHEYYSEEQKQKIIARIISEYE